MTKTVQHETTARAQQIEAVLYVFPRTEAPWLLREGRARYDQMGVPATPHSSRNFELAIEQLRTRASGAAYDERLVTRKGTPADLDLLAHLLAASIRTTSPFR
jgi:hypothetical protein